MVCILLKNIVILNKAYLKYAKRTVVELIKGQKTIKPTVDAFFSFVHHEFGRNKEY